jgi:hypothetical protein
VLVDGEVVDLPQFEVLQPKVEPHPDATRARRNDKAEPTTTDRLQSADSCRRH